MRSACRQICIENLFALLELYLFNRFTLLNFCLSYYYRVMITHLAHLLPNFHFYFLDFWFTFLELNPSSFSWRETVSLHF